MRGWCFNGFGVANNTLDPNPFKLLGTPQLLPEPEPEPNITINLPSNNTTIYANNTLVTFTVNNFVLEIDGHIHVLLNSNLYVMHYSNNSITISNLVNGTYTIRLELVNTDHQSFVPPIYDEILIYIYISSGGISM